MEPHSTDKNRITLNLGPQESRVMKNVPPGFDYSRGFNVCLDYGKPVSSEFLERYLRRMNACQFAFLDIGMKVYYNLPGAKDSARIGFGKIESFDKANGRCVVRCYRANVIPDPRDAKRHVVIPDWTKPSPEWEYFEPCVLREWTVLSRCLTTILDDPSSSSEMKNESSKRTKTSS